MNASFPRCSLSVAQLDAVRRKLLPPLFELADTVTEITDGLRLTFPASPEWLGRCTVVIEQEQAAGSFLRFNIVVEAEQGPVTVEITGWPGTANMLRALSQPPDGQEHVL
jgi:hypothetical protein